MPEDPASEPIWTFCKPLLVRHKADGKVGTAIISFKEVLFFDTNGNITWSDVDYLKEEYELIREYNPGETLSITR